MKKWILLFIICSVTVFGQMRGQMGKRPLERLESFKKVRMLEALKLEEEKGLKLVTRYNQHRESVRSLEEERKGIIDKLEEKVNDGASESEFQKSFNDLIEIEKKILDAKTKYLTELKDILTTKQIAEYLIFERSFARDIRDIMREGQKERSKK
ncbi:MAG: hypothetical protein HYV29_08480 [Ignavibacteriales bacterium]|nr:hypothetical protein [Ignavibacteriales bacterium]